MTALRQRSPFSNTLNRSLSVSLPIIAALLLGCLLGTSAPAEEKIENRVNQPAPTPELPDEFDEFDPPSVTATDSVGLSEWTRKAGPDETIVIGGYGFKPDGGSNADFLVFAQSDGETYKKTVEPVVLKPYRAVVTLPEDLPKNGMYAIYPVTDAGRGRPGFVNRPELWYSLPTKQVAGKKASVYGRNLTHNLGKEKSWVYLKPKGKKDNGTWADVTKVNPYRVQFTVPESLSPGTYELWLHNGHGGVYGWHPLHSGEGGPTSNSYQKVKKERKWNGPTIDVTELGAIPDDDKADDEAVQKALKKANNTKNTTIHFPAGTYYIKKTIGPVKGPDKSGMRIMGAGKRKTFIKGHPDKKMGKLMRITGGNVIVRDLVLDFNHLPEDRKFYSNWERPEHNAEHFAYLAKKKRIAQKRKKWKKKNKGKEVPDRLKPPENPGFPNVRKRHKMVASAKYGGGGRHLVHKKGYKSGVKFINCVLDAERQEIHLHGFGHGLIRNCDVVSNQVIITVPTHTRIQDTHFYGRADSGMMVETYGGWNVSVTNCTAEDYMPNTYDTSMGRFYITTAYGNRPENYYFGNNHTTDLTVNPMHYNQNSGEQLMWESIPMKFTGKLKELTRHKEDNREMLVFDKKINHGKSGWYYDVLITGGKGIGQYHKVANFKQKNHAVTVHGNDFEVKPDQSSTVKIGRTVHRVVVYNNRLDGKPRSYQVKHHIASTSVLAFGAGMEFIVEDNSFHQLRTGGTVLDMFARYENNTIEHVRLGLGIGADILGIVRGNRIKNAWDTAFRVGGGGDENRKAIRVFEHNTAENTPVGLRMGRRLNKEVKNAHVYLYKNTFRHGTNPGDSKHSIGIRTLNEKPLMLEQNRIEGFKTKIGDGKK